MSYHNCLRYCQILAIRSLLTVARWQDIAGGKLKGEQSTKLMDGHSLSFSFRHGNDWSRLTKKLQCHMESLSWHPTDADSNYEVILAKWADRSTPIESFFQKLEKGGLINELITCEPMFNNIYIVSFTGPFHNTVRENLLKYNLTTYNSGVEGGIQKWRMLIPPQKQSGFIRNLRLIGEFTETPSVALFSARDLSSLMWSNQLMPRLFNLLLTEKEIEYILAASELGYFQEKRKLTITEMAALLSRNKSTIDRTLKSAISKLLNCLIASRTRYQ